MVRGQWPESRNQADVPSIARTHRCPIDIRSKFTSLALRNLEFGISIERSYSFPSVRSRPVRGAPCVLTVVGASGTPEYAAEFRRSADLWNAAAAKAGAESIAIGLSDEPGAMDRDRLAGSWPNNRSRPREPLWIVLIGHGTFDGREAKFNLRGPGRDRPRACEVVGAHQETDRLPRLHLVERPVPQSALGREPDPCHGDQERA